MDRPSGVQEVEAIRISRQHKKVTSLLTLCTCRLYPQGNTLLISVSSWVDPRAIVRPEGFRRWKLPMNKSGIEPAALRLVTHYPTCIFVYTHIYVRIMFLYIYIYIYVCVCVCVCVWIYVCMKKCEYCDMYVAHACCLIGRRNDWIKP